MRTLSLVSVLVGVFAVSLVHCGSGAFCDRQSKCPAEPKTDTKACNDDLAKFGACKSQQEAWLNCQYDHEVCTMDGHHDPNATLAYAISSCKSIKDALDQCLAHPDGGTK
jgi:hypothetical protein